jgi:hypothetical protein
MSHERTKGTDGKVHKNAQKGGWRKVRAKSEKVGMFLGERCLVSWRKMPSFLEKVARKVREKKNARICN